MIYADAETAEEYPTIIERVEEAVAQPTEPQTPEKKEQ
jgi:hypothetical protein